MGTTTERDEQIVAPAHEWWARDTFIDWGSGRRIVFVACWLTYDLGVVNDLTEDELVEYDDVEESNPRRWHDESRIITVGRGCAKWGCFDGED